MEKTSKGTLPKWWTNVVGDIERAVAAARESFNTSNVVIGIDTDNDGSPIGYMVRLPNEVGYYPIDTIGHELPIGVKLRGEIPAAEYTAEEPPLESYIYEVIRENVVMIPRMWLRKVIGKIVKGQPITKKEDLKAFPEWVLLPTDKKADKELIDILYRVTRYEGIKGLARFNDLH